VVLVQKWMDASLKKDPAQRYHDAQKGMQPDELSMVEKAKAKQYYERGRLLQLRREELEGKSHDAEECRSRRRRQLRLLQTTLTRALPRTLAAELIGRARGDMERMIRERIVGVLNRLAADMEGEAHA
jgi:hypothetical protein